jgi:hypothetical protein
VFERPFAFKEISDRRKDRLFRFERNEETKHNVTAAGNATEFHQQTPFVFWGI